jgi:hypothetical protein
MEDNMAFTQDQIEDIVFDAIDEWNSYWPQDMEPGTVDFIAKKIFEAIEKEYHNGTNS